MRFYLPKAVEARSQAEDKATGIPVRFVKAWDAFHSLQINRFDTVGGFGNLYQDNAAWGCWEPKRRSASRYRAISLVSFADKNHDQNQSLADPLWFAPGGFAWLRANHVSRTTLSSAVTSASSQANTFALASTSGITAGNTMLYIEGEADFVNAVTTTPPTVTVTRGAGPSSRVSTHPRARRSGTGRRAIFSSRLRWAIPFGSARARRGRCCLTSTSINNVFSDCLGGVWVSGIDQLSPNIIFSPQPGGSVLTGVGTSTTTTDTSLYCTEIYLPTNKLLTGLADFEWSDGHQRTPQRDALRPGRQSAGAIGHHDHDGRREHVSGLRFHLDLFRGGAGPLYRLFAGGVSSSDTLNLVTAAYGNVGVYTEIITSVGTYPQVPATITVPSSFTTLQGPYFAFY